VLNPGDIPWCRPTAAARSPYHGPGQVVAYPLIDLRARGYFVKEYVYRIEESVLRTLAHFGVTGHRVAGRAGHLRAAGRPVLACRADRPAARQRPVPRPRQDRRAGHQGQPPRTYHGVALNVAMDLEPFSRINPCGYAGLQTVDLSTIGIQTTWEEAAQVLSQKLTTYLAP
jgi:lipoyl(octanoyl) transferase